MTATATKPAAFAGSAAAAPDKAADGRMPASSAGTFKFLAWVLVILNVLVAGGWLYMRYFHNAKAESTLRNTRNRLLSLTKNVEALHSSVRYIAQGDINEITDLGTGLVGRVAADCELSAFINYAGEQRQKFGKSHQERTVKVNFLNRRGYAFKDIVKFLLYIEEKNPTVQIKDIDFGRRQPEAIGSDIWIPTGFTVRALQIATN